VTGVQTCALPISSLSTAVPLARDFQARRGKEKRSTQRQTSIEAFVVLKGVRGAKKQAKMDQAVSLNDCSPIILETPQSSDSFKASIQAPSMYQTSKSDNELDQGNHNQLQHLVLVQDQGSNVLTQNRPTLKKFKNLQQMYLDLGQANFGKQIICQTCGMLYVHGLSEDSLQHERICQDYRRGVLFQPPWPRVVGKYGCDIVVEVRPSDSYASQEKVMRVRTIVDNDLGFNCTASSEQRSAFLYIREKRVVGLATAEVLSKAYVLESARQRSRTASKAMVGIHQLWVHSDMRKQGVATRLVDTIRYKFVFGLTVPASLLAFSSPTEAGACFARKYARANVGSTSCQVLVYDCV